MSKYYGYNIPFLGNHPQYLVKQIDDKIIRTDLLQLLLTSKGDRVMRPDYGSGIRSQLFELTDSSNRRTIIKNIKRAVEKYEKRVIIDRIDVQEDDNNILRIKIYGSYSLESGANENSSLLLELGINVGNTEAKNV